jgi:cytochrome b
MNTMETSMSKKILIWDLPTRAFHWLLAVSFTGAFLTAESERFRDVHVSFGYTMLGLIAFRILWGVVGTRYARFASFAFGPRRVLAYLGSILRGGPEHHVGHNPAGSWAIYALLLLGLAAGASGLLTYNEIGGEWLAKTHQALASAMLGVVVIHLSGVIASSLIHRENLVKTMFDGRKRGATSQEIRGPRTAVAVALVAGVLAFWIGQAANPLSAPPEPTRIAAHHAHHEHHGH